MAAEYFVDLLAVFAEGGGYADVVGVGKSRCRDMKTDCFKG